MVLAMCKHTHSGSLALKRWFQLQHLRITSITTAQMSDSQSEGVAWRSSCLDLHSYIVLVIDRKRHLLGIWAVQDLEPL